MRNKITLKSTHSMVCRAILFALFVVSVQANVEKSNLVDVPNFSLKKFDSEDSVSLSDHAGSIVVIDFFAHWCVPCRKATAGIEKYVRDYYAQKRKTSKGLAVQILAINTQNGQERKTRKFIKDTKCSLALNDTDGEVFRKFGGKQLPYIVILAPKADGGFRVVYNYTGYEGAKVLREEIERITK